MLSSTLSFIRHFFLRLFINYRIWMAHMFPFRTWIGMHGKWKSKSKPPPIANTFGSSLVKQHTWNGQGNKMYYSQRDRECGWTEVSDAAAGSVESCLHMSSIPLQIRNTWRHLIVGFKHWAHSIGCFGHFLFVFESLVLSIWELEARRKSWVCQYIQRTFPHISLWL